MQIVMLVIVVVCTITNVCLIFVQMNLRKKSKDLKNEELEKILQEMVIVPDVKGNPIRIHRSELGKTHKDRSNHFITDLHVQNKDNIKEISELYIKQVDCDILVPIAGSVIGDNCGTLKLEEIDYYTLGSLSKSGILEIWEYIGNHGLVICKNVKLTNFEKRDSFYIDFTYEESEKQNKD
ncbi:MAG: hypothetical protein ACRC31_03250 [Cetobacterium sp.]